MNEWKKFQTSDILIGGYKCPCCTPFGTDKRKRGQRKRQLRRTTRRRIKLDTNKKYLKLFTYGGSI